MVCALMADALPEQARQQLLEMMPFAVALGIELDAASPERVVGRMSWAPERCTAGGVLHGGALMALADSLGGICAYLNLPAGAGTATISSSTNLFGAVREGEVIATSQRFWRGTSRWSTGRSRTSRQRCCARSSSRARCSLRSSSHGVGPAVRIRSGYTRWRCTAAPSSAT